MGMGLQELVRQMPDAVVIAEAPSGKMLLANEGARALAAHRGRHLAEPAHVDEGYTLFYPDGCRYEKDDWPILRAVRRGEEITDEQCFELAADGTRLWLRISCSPVRAADGRIVAAVAVARDVTEQTQVEDELRYHAGLVENIDDAVIATDERFLVTTWNRGAERLYGWTADEMLGSDVRMIGRSGRGDARRPKALRKLLESGRSRAELTVPRKDDTPVEVDAINVAIRNEHGEVSGYLGIHRDISERKLAEDALREAQRRSESVLESITDAFVAWDRGWRYTYVNERGLRRLELWGGRKLKREEILGKDMWELFPDMVATEAGHKLREAMQAQDPMEFELFFPPSGEWVEVRAYPSRSGLSVYYRNVTDRKRAEEEREHGARQQALVADLGLRALASDDLQPLLEEAVALVARTLDVERVGIAEVPPGREQVLLRAGEGWNWGDVGDAADVERLGSLIHYTIDSGGPVVSEELATDERFEISSLLSDSGVVSGAMVVIAGRGEPFGSLGAFSTGRHSFSGHDLNFLQAVANVLATAVERTNAEARLEEVRDAERRRIARDLHDEALEQLTHALDLAEGARAEVSDLDTAAPLVPALKRVGQQLRGAIYDLRLDEQEGQPFAAQLEALVALHSAMADCDVELEVRQQSATWSLGRPGVEVLRIVGEALTTARRHAATGRIRVRAWGSKERIYVDVCDDGCGFDLVGKPPAVSGSGMKGMNERAGLIRGALDIRTAPDAGTSVRIEMPLTEDGEALARRVHVLLVEDHACVRQAIASAFERDAGFEVVGEAASLSEARDKLVGVDVAVLDLALPDGYGADLVDELRKVNPLAQALVLSATLDRAEIARAVESGAAGVLNKTADLQEVVEAVRRLHAGETLLPMDEIVELLRFAHRRREREQDERQALAELTAREREILRALAKGLDSQRIADRLHVSIRTVRNHINNILAKLGVHSQLQALVLALRYDVVEIPRGQTPAA